MNLILGKLNKYLIKSFPVALLLLENYAYAQSSESPVGQGLGYIVNAFIYGTDGTVLAVIAFAGSGIAALYHKIHWSVFVGVVAAISIIFGAPAIVSGIKSLVSAS
jgi:type IV secretory pathway VirB2 component (pilin)